MDKVMNSELEHAIKMAGDLPTIPVVATRVMQLIELENVTIDEIARVVMTDPAVAARVIKISNSAYYGCQRQIQSLPRAIVLLGLNTLKTIIVTASVKQVFQPFGLTEKLLWEHSFGAALAARIIAGTTHIVNEEEAFLAGLFHDIGKIVMHTLDQSKFQKVMQNCYNDKICFSEAEKNFFPFSHEEVGAFVINKWNFPETLIEVVRQHHSFNSEVKNDHYVTQLTSIVSLANLFCHKLGIGIREPQNELDLGKSTGSRLCNLSEDQIDSMLMRFEETYENSKISFMS